MVDESLTNLPEPDFSDVRSNWLSFWEHIIKVRQDFWTRWNKEYLNELQKRQKWTKDKVNLPVQTIVLIKEKNVPCMRWPLGRVLEVHPGDDGVVRTATIKTSTGEYKRCVRQLCPLPIDLS